MAINIKLKNHIKILQIVFFNYDEKLKTKWLKNNDNNFKKKL